MNRFSSWLGICFGLCVMLVIGTAGAMPLASTAGGLKAAATAVGVTEQAHGCHHYCAWGPAGRHYHGPRCGRWWC